MKYHIYDVNTVIFVDKLNNERIVVDIKNLKIPGYYWRSYEHKNSIFISIDFSDEQKYNIDYGDVHEAICRWFVDKWGFSLDSFKVTDGSPEHPIGVVAKVEFVDDGETMAKIQGIIN